MKSHTKRHDSYKRVSGIPGAIHSPTPKRRNAIYRDFIEAGEGTERLLIRDAVSRNQLTGTSVYIDEIEMRVGLRIENRGRGRPRHSVK